MEQLSFTVLPTADPRVFRRLERERELQQLLDLIRSAEEGEELLDFSPEMTTRNLAANLLGDREELPRVAMMLSELRRRGALVGEPAWRGYLMVWETVWRIPARPRSPVKRPRPGVLPRRLPT